MTQAQFFRRRLFIATACDRKRRCHCRTDDRERMHTHFDLTREHVRIETVSIACDDFALAQHHRLDADGRGACQDVRISPHRAEGELQQSRPIAQIDEDESAQVATAMHPSTKTHCPTNVGAAKCSTGIGAQGGCQHITFGHGLDHVRDSRRAGAMREGLRATTHTNAAPIKRVRQRSRPRRTPVRSWRGATQRARPRSRRVSRASEARRDALTATVRD